MISDIDVKRVEALLENRAIWRHYDANTYLRSDLFIEFMKLKDLKRIWSINMSQKWGCDADALWKKCPDRCPIFDTPLDYGLGKNTVVRNIAGENNDWFRPSVDHIVARSNGGSSNDVNNMVVISLRANTMKSNLETERELDKFTKGVKKLYFS
jgi:hypothetical protein